MLLIFLTNLVPRLGRGWVGVGGGGEGGEIVQSTCEASYPSVPSVYFSRILVWQAAAGSCSCALPYKKAVLQLRAVFNQHCGDTVRRSNDMRCVLCKAVIRLRVPPAPPLGVRRPPLLQRSATASCAKSLICGRCSRGTRGCSVEKHDTSMEWLQASCCAHFLCTQWCNLFWDYLKVASGSWGIKAIQCW